MYQIALFVHILGVLCLMGGHTLIHASLEVMRRAQQEGSHDSRRSSRPGHASGSRKGVDRQ